MEKVITKNTAELERLEGVINRNLQSFYEVGLALMKIRDLALYRDVLGFDTFEAYCKQKWDFSRSYAYRLIDSAKVIEIVSPIGDKKPETESQARALACLTPEQQREAWQKVIETAPEGKVTAAIVKKVVREMIAPKMEAVSEPLKPTIPKDAIYCAEIAISHLGKISDDDPKKDVALDMILNWISDHRDMKVHHE